MADFIYVAGTALFFLLMYRYVRACDSLGRRSGDETQP